MVTHDRRALAVYHVAGTALSLAEEELPPGGEQSFIMTKSGTTRIHCETHPNMTGTLTVQ